MRIVGLAAMAALGAALGVSGCANVTKPITENINNITVESPFAKNVKHEPIEEPDVDIDPSEVFVRVGERQRETIDAYLAAYKEKDADAMLALLDEEILSIMYPANVVGISLDAIEPGVRDDFAARPGAFADLPRRFRIAPDKWVAFGESVNGEERAPLWMLFDFDADTGLIEATRTQIGWGGFIEGPTVDEPTDAMKSATETLIAQLAESAPGAAAPVFAEAASLYVYPGRGVSKPTPVVTGPSDVASVLALKWGEGAWSPTPFTAQYLQYVFVGAPAADAPDKLDRVALFTFDADPDSPSFEKIIRVDVMGPSGG
ncbi:MAG: hypothetical protein AAGB02_03805 [Pseudomonadota bacterium]